jgi:4-hydroxybenzoate polyprenyltransferase
MSLAGPATLARVKIVSCYHITTCCCLAPVCLLFLYFPVFPLALLPFSLVGLYFTRRGLALARKSGDWEKQHVGYANLVLGIILAGLGVLVLTLAYLWLNS